MTNMIRFSPSSEMRRLQREIDQLFDTFLPVRNGHTSETESAVWTPRVDLAESEEAYLLCLDVPGMTKQDFQISYEHGVLSVSGERQALTETAGQQLVHVERPMGRFYRSFTLPKAVRVEGIKASYENGVLNIHIPKTEESKPHRIQIS